MSAYTIWAPPEPAWSPVPLRPAVLPALEPEPEPIPAGSGASVLARATRPTQKGAAEDVSAQAAPAQAAAHEALPDDELIGACARGEEQAWRILVLRYRRLVYTVPLRMGLQDQDADDVFQNTFRRLLLNIKKLDRPDRIHAWLVTTARRLSLDVLTKRQRHERQMEPEPLLSSTEDSPDRQVEKREARHLVRRALARLDSRSRRLLTLLYYSSERLSYADIAKLLGMPIGSIGPTRARSLAKLHAEYRRLEDGCSDPSAGCREHDTDAWSGAQHGSAAQPCPTA